MTIFLAVADSASSSSWALSNGVERRNRWCAPQRDTEVVMVTRPSEKSLMKELDVQERRAP